MDLPSVLGGLAQGFKDFGTSVVDLFGTGGAAIGDLLQGTGTRNQDDFRKWLYNTDSVKDAAAKGLGTALNGVQTISDYIPGIGAVTRNPLFNAAQGALGGLADEFKMAGENYDLGRAGQRVAVSGAAALAGSSLGDALKKSANPLLQSGLAQGLARGAAGGAINQGGYAAIDGGDVWNSALQGAGMGALLGGATGAIQDFRPSKVYEMPFTEQEKQARIANIDDQLSKLDTTTPDGNARYNELMQARNRYNQTFYHGTPKNPTESGDTLGSGLYITSNKDRATGYANGGDVSSYDTSGLNIANLDDVIPENVAKVLRDNPELSDKLKTLTPTTETYDLAQRDAAYNRFKALKGEYPRDLIEVKKTNSGFDISYPGDVDYTKITGKDLFRKLNTPDAQDVFMRAGYDGVSKTALGGDTEMAIYRNAPQPLESTLADADIAVNSPKLTPEQEAYFKDSVIRDENGNLMPMYHGSRSKFTIFDNSKGGESNKMARVGHWFTPNEQGARRFADQTWYGDLDEPEVYSTYLNIKKPKIYEPIDNSEQINSLQNSISDLRNKLEYMRRGTDEFNETYKQYNDLSKQLADLSYGDPYEQFRSDVYAMEGKSPEQANVGGIGMIMDDEKAATQKYVQSLRDQGYDGIIIKGTGYDGGTLGGSNDQYVVFDSNQIKDINNLMPTPADDIMASRMTPGELDLARALARQDMDVNSAKIAPGQLGLFDDLPTQTPKTGTRHVSLYDQPQDGLDYYGGDIEAPVIEPTNPYAPVNGQITQAMRDRANNILQNADKTTVLPNKLRDIVDASTIPQDDIELRKIIASNDSQAVKEKKITKLLAGVDDINKVSMDKLLELYTPGDADTIAYNQRLAHSRSDGGEAWRKRITKKVKENIKGYSRDTVDAGFTATADALISERLGIAPGQTYKHTSQNPKSFDRANAYGRYKRGRKDISTREYEQGTNTKMPVEASLSTTAHERLHSFQGEARAQNAGRYNQEVIDAYNTLSEELKPYIHDRRTIAKRWGKKDVGYYSSPIEQESRMLQHYLDNNGYTDNPRLKGQYHAGEWGNEINPAFDKFFDKLRDLSKRGVALPALAALFGGGALLATQNNDKEKEVK